MSLPRNPIVVIPARLAATRFPGKPLADIWGEPMIVHVWRRAIEAEIGPVIVACGDAEIAEAVSQAGGRAVMTDPQLPSGSDRIWQAVLEIDPREQHDAVINLQGDAPDLRPGEISCVFSPFVDDSVDIATVAVPMTDAEAVTDPNVVKAVAAIPTGARAGRALYFSRAPVPANEGPCLHHIGLYAFRRAALARFVSLPEGVLERRERLEQLRALEAGMHMEVVLIDRIPLEVNIPADLDRARAMLDRPRQP